MFDTKYSILPPSVVTTNTVTDTPADPRKAQLLATFDKLDDFGKRVLMAQAGSLLTLQRKPV